MRVSVPLCIVHHVYCRRLLCVEHRDFCIWRQLRGGVGFRLEERKGTLCDLIYAGPQDVAGDALI